MAGNGAFRWNYTEDELIRRRGFTNPCYREIAETLARYCDPFVPFDTGTLASDYETFTGDNEGYVRYNQIYAHYQYNGLDFNYSVEKHPLASAQWDRAMLSVKGQQYINEVNRIRKRFAK